jgi:DNA-binding transcriptional ArsR family regulator
MNSNVFILDLMPPWRIRLRFDEVLLAPKKKKSWFTQAPIKTALSCDKDEALRWVNWLNTRPGTRMCVFSPTYGEWHASVSPKSLIKAVNNGHLDLQAWVFANSMQKVVVPSGKGYRTSWVVVGGIARNWVMDMDNVPGASSIDELIEKLKRFKCPIPYLISRTSENRFHLLFTGDSGTWTIGRRYAVALRAAGYTKAPKDKDELNRILKAGGVDPEYMKQSPDRHKIRIAGFTNAKRSFGEFETSKVVNKVVVESWVNLDYKTPTPQDFLDMMRPADLCGVENIAIGRKAKQVATYWKRYTAKIVDLLKEEVGEALAVSLAEQLAMNTKWLQKGEFRINQAKLGAILGISQPTASRILRNLTSAGILSVQDGGAYTFAKRGVRAIYAATDVVVKIKKKIYDIFEPYQDGMTNEHILKDIRYLIRDGRSIPEIADLIMDKQASRGKGKARSRREIERACVLHQDWLERQSYTHDAAG